jgi:hypothetical protein
MPVSLWNTEFRILKVSAPVERGQEVYCSGTSVEAAAGQFMSWIHACTVTAIERAAKKAKVYVLKRIDGLYEYRACAEFNEDGYKKHRSPVHRCFPNFATQSKPRLDSPACPDMNWLGQAWIGWPCRFFFHLVLYARFRPVRRSADQCCDHPSESASLASPWD